MLINNEYPCHCLNTQNVFKWQNLKNAVCPVRTGVVFSSPCIKERHKIPQLKTAHRLYFQRVLYFLKNTSSLLVSAILNLMFLDT